MLMPDGRRVTIRGLANKRCGYSLAARLLPTLIASHVRRRWYGTEGLIL